MMQKSYFLLVLILIPALVLAGANPAKRPIPTYPLITGTEEVNAPVSLPPGVMPQGDGTDQIVGDTLTIGTTWYENQHNGTIGRMVVLDELGYTHFVWMNGLDEQATSRHVYYQFIDPNGVQGWPSTGVAVESAARGGYTTLDVDYGGIAFPAFHQQTTGDNNHTAVACDFFPHVGAFLVFEPDWLPDPGNPPNDMELIWPRIQFDRNQAIHILSTENPWTGVAGDPQRMYYTQGTYNPSLFNITFPTAPDSTWQEISWTMTIAGDVATSEVSDRVAFAWTFCRDEGFPPGSNPSQRNNDVYVLIDDDGQDFHFEDYFNLTQFIEPNPIWLPDTLMADMDTIRAYTDLNIFIDQDDWVHVTFTTPSYFELEGTTYWHASLIWHWSEQFPGEFQVVHDAFDDWWWNFTACGAWNVKAQRPSLGQDPATGNLYCMYQVYDCDTTALSAGGWPSGEVYISMSEDGGFNWSEGINVTHTITPSGAAPYQCLSELTPTMAKTVNDTCHILYVLDMDAGFIVQNEGTWTFNPVKYHKVPVSEIPNSPLVPQYPYDPDGIPFHVEHGTWPGIPGAGRYEQPKTFGLEQNYPNPFNPATSIRFSLDEVSDVSLQVFNLKGEEVATVASGTYGTGQHTVAFDGSGLASGVYIYKLTAGTRTVERKMLLLK